MKTNRMLLFFGVFLLFVYISYHTNYRSIPINSISNILNHSDKTQESDTINTTKIDEFYFRLKKAEAKYFSQNKEDGVIEALIKLLKIDKPGYFVEFGTGAGALETNTRHLRENKNWTGLYLDKNGNDEKINLHDEIIDHETINDVLTKYNVPIEFDILSEDTDYADYWIVQKILTKFKPKIVIHEINQMKHDTCVTVEKPSKVTYWDGTRYHGANVCAFRCLAMENGYTMVYCESKGVNCFWLRNDLFAAQLKQDNYGFGVKDVQNVLTTEYLTRLLPGWIYRDFAPGVHTWHQVKC